MSTQFAHRCPKFDCWPAGALLLTLFASLSLLPVPFVQAEDPAPAAPPAQEQAARQLFSDVVQPLFVQRCYKCHKGEDPEGGLPLDSQAALFDVTQERPFIVPGNAPASELLRRLTTADPTERMPPVGDPVSASEVQAVEHWINAGAPFTGHWAYAPLTQQTVPVIGGLSATENSSKENPAAPVGTELHGPVDAFILDQLSRSSLSMNGPADRVTLYRRLCFDLHGLPPLARDIARFVSDTEPDAYERLVDRLLHGPQRGERLARHWMDLVHYAETHGHDQDRPREHAWPYRDYLIQAFNADLPYGQFVRQQIAGDCLFPNDPLAVTATGFLATGPWDESSLRDIREDSIDREIGRYLDRDDIVSTTISTFLSTTAHCARCHDHKFDPITLKEYYGLQAVFAGIDKGNRKYDPDPRVAVERERLRQRQEELSARTNSQDAMLLSEAEAAGLQEWLQQMETSSNRWLPASVASVTATGISHFAGQADGSYLLVDERPGADTYRFTLDLPTGTIHALQLEVLTDASLPQSGPGRADNGNLHLSEVRLTLLPAAAATQAASSLAGTAIAIGRGAADFNQEGWTIAHALDGNDATAWGIHPQEGQPHTAWFELKEPLQVTTPGRQLVVELAQLHGGNHLIGRPRLSLATGPLAAWPPSVQALPAMVAAAIHTPSAERTPAQQCVLAGHFLQEQVAAQWAALPPQSLVYCGSNKFEVDGSFKPSATPREVKQLKRGDIHMPLEVASPSTLSFAGAIPVVAIPHTPEESARRIGLAEWIAGHDNGLAWRSIANRVWQYHFGRGLVDTPNDFGQMGSRPTHPELLDFLAQRLQQGGGSLRSLDRLLVTSAAYRQSCEYREQAAALDADNRMLWRQNRHRLDAESIRDAALLLSGQLDTTMGGPSVRQFTQSPGVHVTPVVDYFGFDVDSPTNYRRSVYRFVFRTLPDPFMEALDCPDASQWAPVRTSSLTAMQALAMLNDKLLVRLAEKLAAQAEQQADTPEAQIRWLVGHVFLREPAAAELASLQSFAQQHGLANVCRVLLNSNEFAFVE